MKLFIIRGYKQTRDSFRYTQRYALAVSAITSDCVCIVRVAQLASTPAEAHKNVITEWYSLLLASRSYRVIVRGSL